MPKMKILHWNYLIVIFCVMQLQDATTVNWMVQVTNKVVDGLKIHQTFIFTDDDDDGSYAKQENQLISELFRRVPVVMINLRKLKMKSGNRALNSLETYDSTLIVILSRDFDKKIKNGLNTISKMLSSAPRPKCLLITFQEKKSLQSNEEIQKILLDAWNLKYLDFTVMTKFSANQIKMVLFNPLMRITPHSKSTYLIKLK